MADQPSNTRVAEKIKAVAVTPRSPADPVAESSLPQDQIAADQLSPEEQMALFEKELKEKDWGHQPC